jgi:hypothetical protein
MRVDGELLGHVDQRREPTLYRLKFSVLATSDVMCWSWCVDLPAYNDVGDQGDPCF